MIERCPDGSITWNHSYVDTAGCALPQNAPPTGSRRIGVHRG